MDQGIERCQEEKEAEKENHEISVREQEVAERRQEILEAAHATISRPANRPGKTGRQRWLAAST
jgi:hypothetical protein